ncbi:MAG: septum formation initiator family protein [Acidobacteriota bacterium]
MAAVTATAPIQTRKVNNGVILREIDHRHVKDFVVSMFVGMVLMLSILFYVWQRNEFIRAGYEQERLRKELESQLEQQRQLITQRSALQAPDRIDTLARGRLGLVSPGEDQVFLLECGANGQSEMSRVDRAPESLIDSGQ